MTKYIVSSILLTFMVGCSSVDGELSCMHNSSIMKCTLKTVPSAEPRKVSFFWEAPSSPKDDRTHANILAPNHASIFDVRYTKGRAKGTWNITATMDSQDYSTTIVLK